MWIITKTLVTENIPTLTTLGYHDKRKNIFFLKNNKSINQGESKQDESLGPETNTHRAPVACECCSGSTLSLWGWRQYTSGHGRCLLGLAGDDLGRWSCSGPAKTERESKQGGVEVVTHESFFSPLFTSIIGGGVEKLCLFKEGFSYALGYNEDDLPARRDSPARAGA